MPTTTTERKTTPPTVLPAMIFVVLLFGFELWLFVVLLFGDELWGVFESVESKVYVSRKECGTNRILVLLVVFC